MRYSLEWLLTEERENTFKYLFFWGHTPSKDGTISSTCFSQWWESAFVVDGKTYFTAEHWMMEKKALLFGDNEIAKEILKVKSPGEAKKLGRKVQNFVEEIWLKHRMDLVVEGNVHKFSQHPALKEYLLNTGNRVIVEASPRDTIWGIGLGASNEKALTPSTWRGLNLLGFALMEVRDKLK